MWGIHRWLVNSPHKGQRREALLFSFICAWTNDWINNRDAGDLRRYRSHYDVTVMPQIRWSLSIYPYFTRMSHQSISHKSISAIDEAPQEYPTYSKIGYATPIFFLNILTSYWKKCLLSNSYVRPLSLLSPCIGPIWKCTSFHVMGCLRTEFKQSPKPMMTTASTFLHMLSCQ